MPMEMRFYVSIEVPILKTVNTTLPKLKAETLILTEPWIDLAENKALYPTFALTRNLQDTRSLKIHEISVESDRDFIEPWYFPRLSAKFPFREFRYDRVDGPCMYR